MRFIITDITILGIITIHNSLQLNIPASTAVLGDDQQKTVNVVFNNSLYYLKVWGKVAIHRS